MRLKLFKDPDTTLYDSIDDCRSDSNKKGYGCVKKGSLTYYFDLVPTTDPFATKLRYKKKSNGTTYAIADSNFFSIDNYARSKYPDTYRTITGLSQSDKTYLNQIRITSMFGAFGRCENLLSLDSTNWDVSHTTTMTSAFIFCDNLTTLDVSKWNTGKVINMDLVFEGCGKLTQLNVSNWNTSSATNMDHLFDDCKALTSLDVSKWDVSRVTNMRLMFAGCINLTTLNLTSWNISKASMIEQLFSNCTKLTSLDLSNFNTSTVTDMHNIFYGCSSLKVIDISNFDTGSVSSPYDMSNMFSGCDNLQYLILGSTTFKFKLKAYERNDANCSGLNTTCKILVPRALLTTYKAAEEWSSRASQFDAIENYNITRSNGQVTVTPK